MSDIVVANYTQSQLAQLKALGFSDAKVLTPKRLIASVAGLDKTGKTHFCLTAPDPILFFNIDIGTEGVVGKFQDSGKRVFNYDVRVPKSAPKSVYETMWNDLKYRLSVVYGLGTGTVILDTATEGYELARLAYFGKLDQVMPHHYAAVNSEWREILRLAYDSDMNTLFIHKMKPKWVNNQRTSEYEVAGFGETGYMVQINLETHAEYSRDGEFPKFSLFIKNCRQNPNVAGMVIQQPMNTFGFLLDLVHSQNKITAQT